jgi:hypothetical protein
MTEWLLLWLVAAVLYLFECCSWVKHGGWCCIRGRRGWRAASAGHLIGNDKGGIAFSHPLFHAGALLHSAEWPISISPAGVIVSPASQPATATGPRQWAFDEITSVSANFDDVVINGVRIGTGSAALAMEIATHLEELRQMPEAKRASCIRAAIKHNLDVKHIRATWDEFLKQTARLKRTAQATFLFVFVAAPLAFLAIGPHPTWMFLLAGLLGLGVISARQLFVLHRKYFRPAGFDRWVHALSVATFPLAATRAVDRLSKDLFYGRHPVAVICAMCPVPDSESALREQWFDLSIAAAEPYREWYRSALCADVGRVLDRAGFDAKRQPRADDPAVVKFCPRCHGQFTSAADECNDCDDVVLMPLGES